LIDRDLRQRRRPQVLGETGRLQAELTGGDASAQERIQFFERTVGAE